MIYEIRVSSLCDWTSSGPLDMTLEAALELYEQDRRTITGNMTIELSDHTTGEIIASYKENSNAR